MSGPRAPGLAPGDSGPSWGENIPWFITPRSAAVFLLEGDWIHARERTQANARGTGPGAKGHSRSGTIRGRTWRRLWWCRCGSRTAARPTDRGATELPTDLRRARWVVGRGFHGRRAHRAQADHVEVGSLIGLRSREARGGDANQASPRRLLRGPPFFTPGLVPGGRRWPMPGFWPNHNPEAPLGIVAGIRTRTF